MATSQAGLRPSPARDFTPPPKGPCSYLLAALRQATPARLRRPVALYGQPPQAAARLAQLAFRPSVWTLGQLVPDLRLNGVKPPEYEMPF